MRITRTQPLLFHDFGHQKNPVCFDEMRFGFYTAHLMQDYSDSENRFLEITRQTDICSHHKNTKGESDTSDQHSRRYGRNEWIKKNCTNWRNVIELFVERSPTLQRYLHIFFRLFIGGAFVRENPLLLLMLYFFMAFFLLSFHHCFDNIQKSAIHFMTFRSSSSFYLCSGHLTAVQTISSLASDVIFGHFPSAPSVDILPTSFFFRISLSHLSANW